MNSSKFLTTEDTENAEGEFLRVAFVPGETHEIVIRKEPEWGNDSDNPRGKIIEVWQLNRKNTKEGPIRYMHVRMSTDKDYITGGNGNWKMEPVDVDMASVEKGLRILAETGGQNWPGMIKPLALDKIYGVTRRNSEDDAFQWIAYIAWMPTNKPPTAHRPCSSCGGKLETKSFCRSCNGTGGWGNWIETGYDTCVHCDGTGEPQPDESPSMHGYCPKCSLIYEC
jgi:hypothetical protein